MLSGFELYPRWVPLSQLNGGYCSPYLLIDKSPEMDVALPTSISREYNTFFVFLSIFYFRKAREHILLQLRITNITR